ncbi:Na+/H+ antiporter NhaA [Phytoactinopolyspora alkaliphila]|uniref:Na(+)/H(+) antiporter NhaA n=2 Tax=Phytoactinopolyspora alkaliphila TaxID=1783498 RepID=A0A6N9YLE0_9ACTN|nr:Na+/H+ antiporter NhaA [Phytoactinopolyspora alkaliphila]NED95813.1 Na+/H+ antiporter NhaA [Phytoactinopolyspora alkaliphila]
MASDRKLARFVGRPVAAFLRVEASGGILLLAAALIALFWANSAWAESYEAFWHTEFSVQFGTFELSEDLRHWVNDALMAIFFFVVGLEIKYEMAAGELRDPKAAAVPIFAAFGGMVVPAAIYFAFTMGTEGEAGWGIPMATDIAFALGVLAVLDKRIPSAARVFLLTLAIVDDIGAITVIAIFYTDELSVPWLGIAALAILVILALRRVQVWSAYVYVLLGIFVWLATYQSGVHATIAGVILGLLTPAKPLLDQEQARSYAKNSMPEQLGPDELRRYRFLLGESVSIAERLERSLHPWSSYVVLPIFALANAGIDLRGGVLGDALGSPVTLGVAAGLVIGKAVGVTLTSWIAVRFGWGRLPVGASWLTIVGLAMVAGIGFTVSLFITGLAFGDGTLLSNDAKVGVLGGSIIAAALGALFLVFAHKRQPVVIGPRPVESGNQRVESEDQA